MSTQKWIQPGVGWFTQRSLLPKGGSVGGLRERGRLADAPPEASGQLTLQGQGVQLAPEGREFGIALRRDGFVLLKPFEGRAGGLLTLPELAAFTCVS